MRFVGTLLCLIESSTSFGMLPSHGVVNLRSRELFELNMVRNIDLPEAIVWYGWKSIVDASGEPLPGVLSLLKESKEIESASLLLINDDANKFDVGQLVDQYGLCVHVDCAHLPPSPRALLNAIDSTIIQPNGFGGSAGFGTKLADPERQPLAQHVVVLATTEDQCRAARYFGSRVMSLQDNDLADGILFDWSEIGIDDISTPGSFWLNVANAKDDFGNKIDLDELLRDFEGRDKVRDDAPGDSVRNLESEELLDDQLMSILDDLDSL